VFVFFEIFDCVFLQFFSLSLFFNFLGLISSFEVFMGASKSFEVLSLAEYLHFQEVNLLKVADSFFRSCESQQSLF